MFLLQVPAQVQPAEAPPPFEDAAARILDHFDAFGRWIDMDLPEVAPADRPRMEWLVRCLRDERPANPFAKGSPEWTEAEAVRALLESSAPRGEALLQGLPLRLDGSRMAVWAWGRRRVREGAFDAPARVRWENALLNPALTGLAGSYALRHALCFALDARDEGRFADLKARCAARDPERILEFQKLFSLLGSPGPALRLWSLPSLEPRDLRLADLGKREVRIRPLGEGALPAPEGWAWIIPTPSGSLGASEATLTGAARMECEELLRRLGPSAKGAWIAPSSEAFEQEGLSFFPIHISLDQEGRITRIRMGPAAPDAD
ncbi:MAG: hypothetical protein HY823_02650 [Acidobacteria bacterium]|nr:hypothetical protein [Acidobacteriota bacterium]